MIASNLPEANANVKIRVRSCDGLSWLSGSGRSGTKISAGEPPAHDRIRRAEVASAQIRYHAIVHRTKSDFCILL